MGRKRAQTKDDEDDEHQDIKTRKPKTKSKTTRKAKLDDDIINAKDEEQPTREMPSRSARKRPIIDDEKLVIESSVPIGNGEEPEMSYTAALCGVLNETLAQPLSSSSISISAWNVNGFKGTLVEYIDVYNPDVLLVQELKLCDSELLNNKMFGDRAVYYCCNATKAYCGICVATRYKPISVNYGFGIDKFDSEGRMITLEFDSFYLVCSYVPNAGMGLKRLSYRMSYDDAMRKLLTDLKSKQKMVIWIGDLNVAHQEIDLANPGSNKRTPGFTPQERDSFTKTLELGFVDVYRHFHPNEQGAYTFWSPRSPSARASNIGWRLDYAVCDADHVDRVKDIEHHVQSKGSDHCPVYLKLNM